MLTAYLFDQRQGKKITGWAEALQGLSGSQMLWLDVLDASEAEEREVRDALGLEIELLGDEDEVPALDQREDHLVMTAVGLAAAEDGSAPKAAAIRCFVGENWVLTSHAVEVALIEEFRERAEGHGEIGVLDAPTFLAALLESVVTSYRRAFDRIEMDLEEFDVQALSSVGGDAERQISALVDVRRQVGALRRSLLPHRDVFAALSRHEFDSVSTEESAKRFGELAAKTDAALAAAIEAKDAVTGSFDVVIARAEHRTNEIMKILALASILLLPGALIAGVMGMNVNLNAGVFERSVLFWVVTAVIVLLAGATLGAARMRRWI